MTGKRKALFVRTSLAAALALAACVGLSPRAASAKYMADGATQNGTTGGWIAPVDGICVLALHPDGTMDVDTSITTIRDCQARLVSVTAVTANDTLAHVCGTPTLNTAGYKYAAPGSSTCVTVNGSGYIDGSLSMVNLDRGATMCTALGTATSQTTYLANNAAVKTTANGTAAQCIAYGWQYRYQDASGTPLPLNSVTSATSGNGFCYTSVRTGIAVASCPSTLTGTTLAVTNAKNNYSVSGSNCLYAYGTSGIANAALTNINGTVYAAAGAAVDLRSLTQGQCLANGASWANGWGYITTGNTYSTSNGGWTSGTGVQFDLSVQAATSDEGCLHCHSYAVQSNGPAERFKDSYLMTGHKNMLRKVTAGKNWAGPCATGQTPNAGGLCVYTTDGTNPINFMTSSDPFGKVTVSGVDQNLYYIYGDWMVTNPTLVYGTNGYGSTIGTNNGYTCYACHTSGVSDSSLTCTVNPSLNTTAALCTAAGGTMTALAVPGVQSIGISNYAGVQPQASFPGISLSTNNPKWDLEGINCSRCHNATAPAVTAAQVAASGFPTTMATSTGMGNLAAATGRTNLCFGCHQSIAKLYPAQGGPVGGTTQLDPTLIPTGVSHGAAAGREFNGHVLGNSFLNSVHARYAGAQTGNGSITINSLGKYDLTDPNGATEYSSLFKGFTCWQSNTSSSPAKTWIDGTLTSQSACQAAQGLWSSGVCVREFTTQAQCNSVYGSGAWRADDGTTTDSLQGTCSTCHDVHNSLFVASQADAALRKKCADCHVNNSTTVATDVGAPQVVPASINHLQTAGTPFDSTKYDDACVVCHMATQAEANGDQTSMPVHVWRINTSASYSTFPTTGQFYGGTCSVHSGAVQNAPSKPVVYLSDTSSANCAAASGTWTLVTQDRNAQVAAEGTYTKAVWVDLDLACGQCHGGSLGSGATHNGAPYLSKALLAGVANGMHNSAGLAATVAFTDTVSGLTVNVTQAVTCAGGCPSLSYDWNWGDGTPDGSGATASHTYAAPTGTCSNPAFTSLAACVADGDQWDPNSNVWPITLTVTLASGGTTNSTVGAATRNVKVTALDNPPTANATCTSSPNTWTLSVTDTSTDTDRTPVANVVIDWGDLSTRSVGASLGTFTHTYLKPGTYTATLKAIDSALLMSPVPYTCTTGLLSTFTISGTVKNHAGTVNLASAIVQVQNGTRTVKTMYTAGDGTFSAGGLVPGTYTLVVNKLGYTFPVTGPITLGGSSAGNTILAN